MKRLIQVSPMTVLMTMLADNVSAAGAAVPEIDGGMATIALGLTVGIIALVGEYRRRK